MPILTCGSGRTRRKWQFTDAEFAEFQMIFEENEIIEIDRGNLPKLVQTDPPPRK